MAVSRMHTVCCLLLALLLCQGSPGSARVPQKSSERSTKQKPTFRLGKAKSMTFEVTVWGRTDLFGKMEFKRVYKLSVKAVRPGSLRVDVLETANQVDKKQGDKKEDQIVSFKLVTQFDTLVSDGKNEIWLSHHPSYPDKKTYQRRKAPRTLDKISCDGLDAEFLFHPNPLREFKYHLQGKVSLKGTTALVYVITQKEASERVYIEEKTGLPMQISEYFKDPKGEWVEESRIEFTNWTLDLSLPASTFDTQPPAGYTTGE